MAEDPNVKLWRRGQKAFALRDMAALQEVWSSDVVYHFPGVSQLAGDHVGLDAVLKFFAKIVEITEGTLQLQEHDVMATDHHVVALLRLTATRRGRQFAWNQANIYHASGGKATEAWIQPADQKAFDDFFS